MVDSAMRCSLNLVLQQGCPVPSWATDFYAAYDDSETCPEASTSGGCWGFENDRV